MFAVALAPSAQAMPHAPLHRTEGTVIPVRERCGLERQLEQGVCVLTVRATATDVPSESTLIGIEH
jgi:hypothetical protein